MSEFQKTSLQLSYERISQLEEENGALREQLGEIEKENETLGDLLEALFFFARAEIQAPVFRAFVAEHEELGRMFPIVGDKLVNDAI